MDIGVRQETLVTMPGHPVLVQLPLIPAYALTVLVEIPMVPLGWGLLLKKAVVLRALLAF